jgi:cellulose biosynthesis protein BcsQ
VGAILADPDPRGWAEEIAVPAGHGWSGNLRVVASHREVANRERSPDDFADARLRAALEGTAAELVVLDCPNRSGGLVTVNALTAADSVLYPCRPNEDGLEGVAGARLTVQRFRAHQRAHRVPETLNEVGIVLCAAVRGSVWTRDATRCVEVLRESHRALLLNPFVPDRVTVPESRAAGTWFGDYPGGAAAAEAYAQIAAQVISALGKVLTNA